MKVMTAMGLLFLTAVLPLCADFSLDYYEKGLVYYLLDDKAEAQKRFESFFISIREPILRRAYNLLIAGEYWDSNRIFKSYLNTHKYSIMALVGIGLSNENTDEKIEFLKRAIRFHSGKAQPYACLAVEYLRRENYKLSRDMIQKAIALSDIREYKLIYAKIFLILKEYRRVLDILLPEQNRMKENFFFNYYLANAFFSLNDLKNKKIYIDRAINLKPDNYETRLLLAKYYLKAEDYRKAHMILRELKSRADSFEYYLLYAELLLKLRDNACLDYLNQAFFKDRWDTELIHLFVMYYQWKGKEKTRDRWIERGIISGIPMKNFSPQVPGIEERMDSYPEYHAMPFFSVSHIQWLDERRVVVVGTRRFNSRPALHIIEPETMKVITTFPFSGKFDRLFVFDGGGQVIFSVNNYSMESVALYRIVNKQYIRTISKQIPLASVFVEYDRQFQNLYITDDRVNQVLSESPFVIKLKFGKRQPVFPDFPFYIYKYNLGNGRLARVKKFSEIRHLNMKAVKKYYLISEQKSFNNRINQWIQNAEKYDLSSDEEVRIFIPEDLSGFIVYYSDLEVPFKGVLYEKKENRFTPISTREVLATSDYIGLEIVGLHTDRKEILLITKDERRTLIRYNYENHLISRLSSRCLDFAYDTRKDCIYIIKEKSRLTLWPETQMQLVYVNPFFKKSLPGDYNLEKIVFHRNRSVYINTFKGDLVTYNRLFPERGFEYVQPSFSERISARRWQSMENVVFVNKRLVYIHRSGR